MKIQDKGTAVVIAVYLAFLAIGAAFWVTIGYVLWHFISKMW